MNKTIRKALSALLAIGILLTTSLTAFAATAGDVNADGKVNSIDALSILSHAVGITPSKFDKSAADLNADGKINSTDALIVLKIAVGLDVDVMSKENIVKLYNNSVNKACKQSKCTLVVSNDVDAVVNKVLIDGEEDPDFNTIFSDILENAKFEDEKFTFYNGKTLNGEKAEDLLSSISLSASEVKAATAKKQDGGYKLTFSLYSRTEDLTDNNDMSELFNFKSYIAEYPFTEITAVVDSNGRISSVEAHIVANLEAEANNTDMQLYMDVSLTQHTTYKFSY